MKSRRKEYDWDAFRYEINEWRSSNSKTEVKSNKIWVGGEAVIAPEETGDCYANMYESVEGPTKKKEKDEKISQHAKLNKIEGRSEIEKEHNCSSKDDCNEENIEGQNIVREQEFSMLWISNIMRMRIANFGNKFVE